MSDKIGNVVSFMSTLLRRLGRKTASVVKIKPVSGMGGRIEPFVHRFWDLPCIPGINILPIHDG